RGRQLRLIAIDKARPTDQPGGVLAATRQRPVARSPVATVNRDRLAIGPERSSGDHLRIGAVDLARCGLGQAPAEDAVQRADHQTPPDRAIDSMARTSVAGSHSAPPSTSGTPKRN